MSEQERPDDKHKTTRRGTGQATRKKVTRAPSGPVDPPEPPGFASRTLDKDPKDGADFRFVWTHGACKHSGKDIQCAVDISDPRDWESTHIVTVNIPEFKDLSYGGPNVRFHKRVAPQFQAFFSAAGVKGLKSRILTQVGAYVSRTVTGSTTKLSNHALGTAIDINVAWNQRKKMPAARGATGSVAELADFCADFGIYWGGWYERSPKDGMHFECVTVQSEAQLRAACTTHGVDYDALFNTGAGSRTPKTPVLVPPKTPVLVPPKTPVLVPPKPPGGTDDR